MASSPTFSRRTITRTDALINGLFSGIFGGLVMLLFLILADVVSGNSPISTLQRFSIPGQTPQPLTGAFLHLSVSAVYGGIFGFILHLLPQRWVAGSRKIFAGLVYGVILYSLATTLLLPSSGSALMEVPTLVFGIAHAIYGVVLGRFSNV